MTDSLCPVCQGRRTIRVPLYFQLDVLQTADTIPEPHESSRTYDCPECVKKAPFTRMGTMKLMSFMDGEQLPEKTKEWWRDNAAKTMGRMIAEKLIEDGFIQFETVPPDAYHAEGIRATIRAILPAHVATFEERVAERQMDVAAEVADEAQRLIDNWGSYFGAASINKDTANREIRCAVENIRKKREKQ